MEVKIEEEEGGKKILKTEKKHHTIMSLLRKYMWDSGIDTGYDEGHPYLGGSNLVIETDDLEENLKESISDIKEDLDNFKEEFDS